MAECHIQNGTVPDTKWQSATHKMTECQAQNGRVSHKKWHSVIHKMTQCYTQNGTVPDTKWHSAKHKMTECQTEKTDCQTHNDSSHRHVFVAFKCCFFNWPNWTINQLKHCCKSIFLFHSHPYGPDASSPGVPLNPAKAPTGNAHQQHTVKLQIQLTQAATFLKSIRWQ